DQVVAGEGGERRRGAGGGPAGGEGAEDQPAEGGGGQIAGVLLRDLEAVERLLAPALDLVLRERGMEDDVRKQVEAEVELVGGDGGADVAGLGAGAGAEFAAAEVDRLGDLLRGGGGRPFGEQRGGGARQPRLVVRLVGLA